MRWIYTLMVVQFVGGCKKDGASGPQEDPRDDGVALESITVEPETVTLETGPAGAATAIFTATGHYADGVSRPLDLVSWTVSNKSAGEVDEVGEFTSVTTNGGVT